MESVRVLQARMVTGESWKSLSLGLASAWLIGGALWDRSGTGASGARVAAWVTLLSLVLLRGIVLAQQVPGAPAGAESVLRASRRLAHNGAAASVLWGLSSFFLLPARDLEHEAILVLGIALITMAAAVGRAIYAPIVQFFVLATSFVFAAGLLTLPGELHRFIGFGYMLFGVVIALFCRAQVNTVERERSLNIQIEKLLQQAEGATLRAEEATVSKQRFLAAVSHDLAQPLHAMVHFVAHLERSCVDAQAMPTIRRIDESVTAMGSLLNTVLEYSKLSMGAVTADLRTVSVDEVLQRIDSQFRTSAEAKGLQLRIAGGGLVRSDPLLLDRVLWNVMQNAIRYTAQGGIAVHAVERGDSVRVCIIDSGVGIAADQIARIFDEYFQIGDRVRVNHGGLGLGLSIVRELASVLQLRLRVRSRPGVGTCVVIDIPGATAESGAPEDPEAIGSDSRVPVDCVRGAFVVLIDDDTAARDAMAATLRSFGCRVVAEPSPDAALAVLRNAEFTPQMVVSDLRLDAGASGLTAIASLRAWHRVLLGGESSLPAILISGNPSAEERDIVSETGLRLLHKPVAVAALYGALNSELSAHLAEIDR